MSTLQVILFLVYVINLWFDEARGFGTGWIDKAFGKHKNKFRDAKFGSDKKDIDSEIAEEDVEVPGLNSNSQAKKKIKRNRPFQNDIDPMKHVFDAMQGNGKPQDPLKLMKNMFHPLNPEDILNEDDYENNQFDNPLEMHDFETQHSFQHPLDMITQNWIILGDAVGTTNFARLTPDEGGRRGVLWNKFSLHLDEWQILFEINVHSKNKLGGDGFGVFLLNEDDLTRIQQDANDRRGRDRNRNRNRNRNQNSFGFIEGSQLLGDFYGIRRDFNGTGIIFDTYDNNNNGDNPLVFSVSNDGKSRKWDMQNDLEEDRKRSSSDSESLFGNMLPLSCTIQYKDVDAIKIMIRYQDKKIHVYTALEPDKIKEKFKDNMPGHMLGKHGLPFAFGKHFGMHGLLGRMGMGGKKGHAEAPHLCMVKNVDLDNLNNIHIAISANTGQIADAHDVLKFETKYLRREHKIDDDLLPLQGYKKRSKSTFIRIFWFIICTLSVGLLAETISEITIIRNIYTSNMHIVKCINKINPFIQLSYALFIMQYILLVFSFNWKCLLCNSPLLLIRAHKFMTNNALLTPQKFEQPVYLYKTTYRQWLWVQLILLSLSAFYNFWRLFHI